MALIQDKGGAITMTLSEAFAKKNSEFDQNQRRIETMILERKAKDLDEQKRKLVFRRANPWGPPKEQNNDVLGTAAYLLGERVCESVWDQKAREHAEAKNMELRQKVDETPIAAKRTTTNLVTNQSVIHPSLRFTDSGDVKGDKEVRVTSSIAGPGRLGEMIEAVRQFRNAKQLESGPRASEYVSMSIVANQASGITAAQIKKASDIVKAENVHAERLAAMTAQRDYWRDKYEALTAEIRKNAKPVPPTVEEMRGREVSDALAAMTVTNLTARAGWNR